MDSIRIMASYNSGCDLNEYLPSGDSTANEALRRFCDEVILYFELKFLQTPISRDTEKILTSNVTCGFLGMLGSIDCTHSNWKNFPTTWADQYTIRCGIPTIILEVVQTRT